jgi:hypothetical protein
MDVTTPIPELITDPKALDERAVIRYLEHLARHPGGRPGEIEQDFVEAAVRYSIRERITPSVWHDFGVPRRVLAQCGFSSPEGS